MVGFWERFFVGLEANDFLAQVETWKLHNVGGTEQFEGNHHKALASIRARTLVMPCTTDTYFPAEDAQEEVADIPNATFKAIPSVWGHWAGFGVSDTDRLFLNDAISKLLEEG
jgi:homoserine O-acetyltransferase